MDPVRFGQLVRALRRRLGWRQVDLAAKAGVSQSLIARVERGGGDRLTVRSLRAISDALGARLSVRLDWNGEAADRLLDQAHAALVEIVIRALRDAGWEAFPEVTFSIYGERGSIDILAWRAGTAELLIIEIKSDTPDAQAMLATHDRKVRLSANIARDRGWAPRLTSELLVIADTRTARRRVAEHAATFDARFPDRGARIKAHLRRPTASQGSAGAAHAALRGLWFLPVRTEAGSRQRVASRRVRVTHEPGVAR